MVRDLLGVEVRLIGDVRWARVGVVCGLGVCSGCSVTRRVGVLRLPVANGDVMSVSLSDDWLDSVRVCFLSCLRGLGFGVASRMGVDLKVV